MAAFEYGQAASPRVGRIRLAVLSSWVASRGLPLVVGVILVLPLGMLLTNSLNVAPAGQAFRYGLGNWQSALADPTALGTAASLVWRLRSSFARRRCRRSSSRRR